MGEKHARKTQFSFGVFLRLAVGFLRGVITTRLGHHYWRGVGDWYVLCQSPLPKEKLQVVAAASPVEGAV